MFKFPTLWERGKGCEEWGGRLRACGRMTACYTLGLLKELPADSCSFLCEKLGSRGLSRMLKVEKSLSIYAVLLIFLLSHLCSSVSGKDGGWSRLVAVKTFRWTGFSLWEYKDDTLEQTVLVVSLTSRGYQTVKFFSTLLEASLPINMKPHWWVLPENK